MGPYLRGWWEGYKMRALTAPKPPGYEHLSYKTIDAIRATSTKPK